MEQLTSRILRRSSDAVVIVRLSDATVLGVNKALSAVTGHPQHQLVGQPIADLLVGLGPTDGPMSAGTLGGSGPIMDAPTGLWSRSRELRTGYLSALVVELDGQRHAVCTVRGIREPTPVERGLAARELLNRILRTGGPWPQAATSALESFGRCLRWEFGAIWSAERGSQRLRCAAVWNGTPRDLEELEHASWQAAFAPGEGLLGRAWRRREPTWLADASADPGFRQWRGRAGEPVHGWLGFPASGSGGVVGVVEFISREPRRPSEDLLRMIEDFDHLFGRLLEELGADEIGPATESGPGSAATREAAPRTVSDALRGLVGAVTAMTEALERQPVAAAQEQSPALVEELAAGIGELNRLLGGASDPNVDDSLTSEPAEPLHRLPTGLTLKAVSQRTGIPAATLRTWERRYGFLRPLRSSGGYRLYGEEEIARIQQVKYLLDQGIRIGAAMEAVTGGPELAGAPEPAAGETRPQPHEDDG
jgi:MerR-like DNA binding protein/GAF domain-containing protein